MPQSIIHSSLVISSLERCNVPLGGALTVTEGGDSDGCFKINTEADDFNKVMSALVGAVLEAHALKTMVMPSNGDRLKNALGLLTELHANRFSNRLAENYGVQLADAIEDIEAVQSNLKEDN